MRATDWLSEKTGRSAAWWMSACQTAITSRAEKSDDLNHDDNDPELFLHDVAHLVVTSLPKDGNYDPNMRVAAVMGVVLVLWKSRVHYCKTQDPMRPVSSRQNSYDQWAEWTQVLISAVMDERDDPTYFPGQKFEHPFSFDATDGEFI